MLLVPDELEAWRRGIVWKLLLLLLLREAATFVRRQRADGKFDEVSRERRRIRDDMVWGEETRRRPCRLPIGGDGRLAVALDDERHTYFSGLKL